MRATRHSSRLLDPWLFDGTRYEDKDLRYSTYRAERLHRGATHTIEPVSR